MKLVLLTKLTRLTVTEKLAMIGTRIPEDWVAKIDAVCEEIGLTRSQVVMEAIAAYLEKPEVNTVNSVQTRLAAVEKKLSRLANSMSG